MFGNFKSKNIHLLDLLNIIFFQRMLLRLLLGSVLLTVISLTGVSSEGTSSDEVSKFQKLFMQKRIEQLAAVKNILKLDDVKRKSLLDQITSKLFQVCRWRVRSGLKNSN